MVTMGSCWFASQNSRHSCAIAADSYLPPSPDVCAWEGGDTWVHVPSLPRLTLQGDAARTTQSWFWRCASLYPRAFILMFVPPSLHANVCGPVSSMLVCPCSLLSSPLLFCMNGRWCRGCVDPSCITSPPALWIKASLIAPWMMHRIVRGTMPDDRRCYCMSSGIRTFGLH